MRLLLFCLCMSLVVVLSQALPHKRLLRRRSANRYCGDALTNILATVCNSNYYPPSYKRDEDPIFAAPEEPWWRQIQQSESRSPLGNGFVDSQLAMSLLGKRELYGQPPRGVYDECCRKGCTFNELSSYCGNNSSD